MMNTLNCSVVNGSMNLNYIGVRILVTRHLNAKTLIASAKIKFKKIID